MPLEIKELHVKAVVGAEKESGAASPATAQDDGDREALVAECVEQVLEILREKTER